jgi:hypothetical protein
LIHNIAAAVSPYGEPSVKNIVGASIALALAVFVCKAAETAYIEWPDSEPLSNVLALIAAAERDHGVAFDLEDPDLWEQVPGGVRLHGIFRERFI